ncbi:8585_t:CDS:2 [Paraglomus occultum]|uniref:8585_t:CDS:1 n=1 Tax=Paraglomus occultum TaxID=144539 RepID=A0A9N8W446_9GLOM|nr:8585_t:CDS:2 [Paraglomus occultum]
MARLFTITSLLFLFLCTIPLVTAQSSSCSGPQNACKKVNDSLVPCDGYFSPPPSYALNGTYGVRPGLAACQCNIDYYNTLTACVECYSNGNNDISVDPLSIYKYDCQAYGYAFSDNSQTSTKSKSNNTRKVAICVAVGLVVIIIVAVVSWRVYKKKRNKKRAQTVAHDIATEGSNGNSGAANGTNMAQTNVNAAAFIVPPDPIGTPPPPYSIQKQTAVPPTQRQPAFRLAPSVYDPYLANGPRYSTVDSLNGIEGSAYSPHNSWNVPSVYSSDSQVPLGMPAYSPHDSLRSWNGTSGYSTSNYQMPTHGMPVYTTSDPNSMLGAPTREYPQQ